jgi:hypothetical protein
LVAVALLLLCGEFRIWRGALTIPLRNKIGRYQQASICELLEELKAIETEILEELDQLADAIRETASA